MKRMLKSELFKFRNSYALWVIIGVITVSCCFSILTGVYDSAELTLSNIAKDSIVPILACAIYSAIILTDDFSNGLLRHYIANGYKRSSIILAKFIHYILGCSILLFLYPCFCVSLTAILYGTQTTPFLIFQKIIFMFILELPLYWGIFGLFFFFSIFIQKGVIAMGISVATSILLVVFTNKFYDVLSILKYSPVIQIGKVANGTVTSAYFISVLLSLTILFICVFGSVMKFSNEEL